MTTNPWILFARAGQRPGRRPAGRAESGRPVNRANRPVSRRINDGRACGRLGGRLAVPGCQLSRLERRAPRAARVRGGVAAPGEPCATTPLRHGGSLARVGWFTGGFRRVSVGLGGREAVPVRRRVTMVVLRRLGGRLALVSLPGCQLSRLERRGSARHAAPRSGALQVSRANDAGTARRAASPRVGWFTADSRGCRRPGRANRPVSRRVTMVVLRRLGGRPCPPGCGSHA